MLSVHLLCTYCALTVQNLYKICTVNVQGVLKQSTDKANKS